MKKIFLMMAFVAISFVASAQNSRFDVKIGYGWANLYGDNSDDIAASIFSWKIGAGYEFRVGKLIGIEPSLMIDSKGAKRYDLRYSKFENPFYSSTSYSSADNSYDEYYYSPFYDDDEPYGGYKRNVFYLEMPVMCKFHFGDRWVLGAGAYAATLIEDDDTNCRSFDAGACFSGEFQFDNGLFFGTDMTVGLVPLYKSSDLYNRTVTFVLGYKF